MKSSAIARAVVVAALAFTLGACASGEPQATETESAESVSAGNAADPIAFSAIDVETGERFDGASLKGSDTMIWFWASWCPICEAESGAIVNAAAEPDWPEGVTLIGVAGLSDAAEAKVFVDEHGVGDFQHVYDTDGSIWSSFGVTSQPSLALVNDDGTFTVITGGIGKWDILNHAKDLAAS